MKYLVLFASLFVLGCTEHNLSPEGASSSKALTGAWVEATNRKDTITFIASEPTDPQMFHFRSEKGIAGYNQLHSTSFQFKINEDKISLLNTLSSCYCFTDYRFSTTDQKLQIENFYDEDSKGVMETFVPVE